MLFIWSKIFLFWRYLNSCSDIFGLAGERFDKRTKVNFKVYDITNKEVNNYNTLYCSKSQRVKVNLDWLANVKAKLESHCKHEKDGTVLVKESKHYFQIKIITLLLIYFYQTPYQGLK